MDPYSGQDLHACRLVTVTDIELVLDDDGQPIYPVYEHMYAGTTNLERAAARGKGRRGLLRRRAEERDAFAHPLPAPQPHAEQDPPQQFQTAQQQQRSKHAP